MSVREAVPAVIAADGPLDQAGAVAIASASERQEDLAGVAGVKRRRRWREYARRDGVPRVPSVARVAPVVNVPRDRVAHERPQFLIRDFHRIPLRQ